MVFTSYAQNFEDVMLWRALKHVERGTYIDIGAWDPSFHSVSKAFYQQGWRGISVEPNPRLADAWRRERPDELLLQAVVSENTENVTFYEVVQNIGTSVASTGMSTMRRDLAEEHRRNGFDFLIHDIPSVTFDHVLERIASDEIHWLKIDVEGCELSTLKSWSKSPRRPWIIVVESIDPVTRKDNYEEWEHLIFSKGYSFAYFDGLNRYYISENNEELKKHFSHGLCLWDDVKIHESIWFMDDVVQRHKNDLEQLRVQSCQDIAQALAERDAAHHELHRVRDILTQAQQESSRAHAERDVAQTKLAAIHHELRRTLDFLTQTQKDSKSVHIDWDIGRKNVAAPRNDQNQNRGAEEKAG